MHTFRLAFVFAAALTACNVPPLHAAPLPTNVEGMKSMAADSSINVRWGGLRGGGWGYGGFGWGAGALAGAVIGGAIANSAYGYYGGPYYPAYSYYPAYGGYAPYYVYGTWQAIQEPGEASFYRPYGYGRPWGY